MGCETKLKITLK